MTERTRASGFTLLEMAISLGIFALLMVSMFTIAIETSSFISDNDAQTTAQMEGNRAFQRFSDLLRKSGRTESGGVTYPRILNGGSELEFRVLADLDGNGYPFEEGSGELEWDPAVYTVKTDADDNLAVYEGADLVYFLGRYISNLSFETVDTNPALHLREVEISYEARKNAPGGTVVVYIVQGGVHMRN